MVSDPGARPGEDTQEEPDAEPLEGCRCPQGGGDLGQGRRGAGLALRTYTTRLLGRDPALVLHGGGNTSLKTRMTDLAGEMREVLCVKASGRDMAEIDPSGFAAVDLAPLRKLRALDNLSDADMARAQRAWLIDPLAPDPSVEFLLHAFMPHTYIDHTHANAVLALIDREGGANWCTRSTRAASGSCPIAGQASASPRPPPPPSMPTRGSRA